MSSLSFLYLTQEEMIEAGVLDATKCNQTIEEVFKLLGQDDYLLPGLNKSSHGTALFWPEKPTGPKMPSRGPDKRIMAMPAYIGGDFHMAGVKWYGSNTVNPKKHGWPRSIHFVILNEPEYGYPLAIMDGTLISAMRTGAVPAVGAKYLARDDSEIIGLIGAGVINRSVLRCLVRALDSANEVRVYDIFKEKSISFSEEMSQELGVTVLPVDNIKKAVEECDVINVASSALPENHPYIEYEWLKEGGLTVFTSPIKGSDIVLTKPKIVVDLLPMHYEWIGEGWGRFWELLENKTIQMSQITELRYLVANKEQGRTNDKEKIIFQTGGIPVEDVAWGTTVYREALKKKIGTQLKLWDKPYWF
jgi:ornithine cyclodeaminase